LELTENGFKQAQEVGVKLKQLIGDENVSIYLSPYQRTYQTSRMILKSIPESQIGRIDIEPGLREQEFGNTQNPEKMEEIRREQMAVGRFWYRFPHGESGADVYQRVAAFWTEFRDSHMHIHQPREKVDNVLIITHGLTMRFILSVVYHWSPDTFETVWNPSNCEMWVLELNPQKGRYFLSNAGSLPKSTRKVTVHYKDGTCKEHTVADYLSLPQPRTEHPLITLERLKIDPATVDSIDWWNGKFKSNFSYGDNLPGSSNRKQVGRTTPQDAFGAFPQNVVIQPPAEKKKE